MKKPHHGMALTLAAALAVAALTIAAAVPAAASGKTQSIVFSGGCFWGVEAVFESLKGVTSAVAGYAGGSKATAHYDIVSTGTTGHAESVQVTFDPAQISLDDLFAVFFFVAHDPTELNRQGPDDGTQYRSVIFYSDDGQRRAAQAFIAKLSRDKAFAAPIVTQVVALPAFYPAEDYHQHFVQRNPYYPYVVINDLPKLETLKKRYPALVKPSS